MSTPTPVLNGQVLGEAEHATRAVLDRLLQRIGTTFHQWVALNTAAVGGGTIERRQLVDRMIGGLKVDEAPVQSAIAELLALGMFEEQTDGSALRLAPSGEARQREVRAAIAGVTARLYADLPAEDLAVAGRVLTLLTARANAELDTIG